MVRKNVDVAVATPSCGVRHRVLHGDDQDLHDQPDAQPGDEHEDGHLAIGGVRAELSEQEQADGEYGGADDGEHLVPPGAGDQPAAHDEGEQHAADHGQELEARKGGRGAVDDLEVQGQVDDGPEHGEADDEPDAGGRRERPVLEQPSGMIGSATFVSIQQKMPNATRESQPRGR